MYRDDPLADEEELRAIIGDDAVDRLLETDAGDSTATAFDVAMEVLRVLQGWADDDQVGEWFTAAQARLGGRTPVSALCDGDEEDVRQAARSWAAAHA